jgi:hypothetical protein
VRSIEPGEGTLTLQLELPYGYKINALAPSALTITTSQSQVVGFTTGAEQTFRNPHFPVEIPINVGAGEGTIRADFVVYYCEAAKESLCYFKEARLSIPVKVTRGSGNHKLSALYKLRLSE